MGWDAFANTTKGHIKSTFRPAAKEVMGIAGSVDFGLERGWLDCSACAKALQDATGSSCYDRDGWSAEQVKRLAENAVWDVEEHEAWALYSAKYFLEACAKINTGIHFSW